jgi:hypothetical protein
MNVRPKFLLDDVMSRDDVPPLAPGEFEAMLRWARDQRNIDRTVLDREIAERQAARDAELPREGIGRAVRFVLGQASPVKVTINPDYIADGAITLSMNAEHLPDFLKDYGIETREDFRWAMEEVGRQVKEAGGTCIRNDNGITTVIEIKAPAPR